MKTRSAVFSNQDTIKLNMLGVLRKTSILENLNYRLLVTVEARDPLIIREATGFHTKCQQGYCSLLF